MSSCPYKQSGASGGYFEKLEAAEKTGIQFNSSSHYVTNMQAGSVSITLSSSSGSTATNTVKFNNYSKGNGSWHIVTTVNSSTNYPESVITCVSSVSSSGFTL